MRYCLCGRPALLSARSRRCMRCRLAHRRAYQQAYQSAVRIEKLFARAGRRA